MSGQEHIPLAPQESLPPIVGNDLRGAAEYHQPEPEPAPAIVGNDLRGRAERPNSSPEQSEATAPTVLAEHLAVVAEHGPDAVKTYISDLLADTTGKAPRTERAALFGMLAERQAAELKQEVLITGAATTRNMLQRDRQLSPGIAEAGNTVRRDGAALPELHRQRVGRAFNGGVDARLAARSHEEIAQEAGRFVKNIEQLPGRTEAWKTGQTAELGTLSACMNKNDAHAAALSEARKTLRPEYEGEAKDLGPAISDKVKTEAATQIFQALAAAEGDPAAVIASVIADSPNTGSQDQTVAALRAFSATYTNLLRSSTATINTNTSEISRRTKKFIHDGQLAYKYPRRSEEVANAYQYQNTAIRQVTQAGVHVAGTIQNALRASSDMLRGMDRQLQGTVPVGAHR